MSDKQQTLEKEQFDVKTSIAKSETVNKFPKIKRDATITVIKVDFQPEVMAVVAEAIYDGVFLSSGEKISEDYLNKVGFTQDSLTTYLKNLVKIRQGLVTVQVRGNQRTISRNLYVPAGVAQMLVGLGEVRVGDYLVTPTDLREDELTAIDWKWMEAFSLTLLRLDRVLYSVKNILIPDKNGDASIMCLLASATENVVDDETAFDGDVKSEKTVTLAAKVKSLASAFGKEEEDDIIPLKAQQTRKLLDDCVIKVHANAVEGDLHPAKQAFALMAGITLVNSLFDVVYPSVLPVPDWKSSLYSTFSQKVDE